MEEASSSGSRHLEEEALEEVTIEEGDLFQEGKEEILSVMLVGRHDTCLGNVLKTKLQVLEKLMLLRLNRRLWRQRQK
jgi:hypothetical protein